MKSSSLTCTPCMNIIVRQLWCSVYFRESVKQNDSRPMARQWDKINIDNELSVWRGPQRMNSLFIWNSEILVHVIVQTCHIWSENIDEPSHRHPSVVHVYRKGTETWNNLCSIYHFATAYTPCQKISKSI